MVAIVQSATNSKLHLALRWVVFGAYRARPVAPYRVSVFHTRVEELCVGGEKYLTGARPRKESKLYEPHLNISEV